MSKGELDASLATRRLLIILAKVTIEKRLRAKFSGMTVQQRDVLWHVGARRIPMRKLAHERGVTPSQLKTDLAVLVRRKMIRVTQNSVSATLLGRQIAKEEGEQHQLVFERVFAKIPYWRRRHIRKGIEILAETMRKEGLA
jgi:DNA-binding MarR family transcriptional regulator